MCSVSNLINFFQINSRWICQRGKNSAKGLSVFKEISLKKFLENIKRVDIFFLRFSLLLKINREQTRRVVRRVLNITNKEKNSVLLVGFLFLSINFSF